MLAALPPPLHSLSIPAKSLAQDRLRRERSQLLVLQAQAEMDAQTIYTLRESLAQVWALAAT